MGKCGCVVAGIFGIYGLIIKMPAVGSAVASEPVLLKVTKAHRVDALLN